MQRVPAGSPVLDQARFEFRRLKDLGAKALAQAPDPGLHHSPATGMNSLAVLVRHLAGNMRSRWTDFLASDGEKPWRRRDDEFAEHLEQGRAELLDLWEAGWSSLFTALDALTDADLPRPVVIRGEPHTVLQAIARQMTHVAYHVGQMVFLARQIAGRDWHWLSVPPGQSEAFNQHPTPYGGGARSRRVLFVCVENSNRSQMAEAFAQMHGGGLIEPASAGSRPSGTISPKAIAAMRERGYDLGAHRSKDLNAAGTGPWEYVITLGCGDECPWVPAVHREDWSIADPREMGEDEVRAVRDAIEARVLELIDRIRQG